MEKPLDETFDEIQILLNNICNKVQNKVISSPVITQKKNSHLHMIIETSSIERLKIEAKEKSISLAELVRQKLRANNQLNRIEGKLNQLSEFICKRKD